MSPEGVRNQSVPLIISVGVTGSVTTRDQCPTLPITPTEIADSALRAWESGASVAHIHVREDDGTPSARAELYAEVFSKIRASSDMLICATTGSGGGRFNEDERLAALNLGADLASFDAGSVNFGRRVFMNSPDFLDRLAGSIIDNGVLPEIECFEIGMITNTVRNAERWGFPGSGKPWWFQLCLGIPGAAPPTANALLAMKAELPPDSEWSVLGVGAAQLRLAMFAIIEGGHVRVGLEDNVYYRKGVPAKSNAELVKRVVDIAAELDRPIADPSAARQVLGLGSPGAAFHAGEDVVAPPSPSNARAAS